MTFLDWSIVGSTLVLIIVMAIRTKKYTKSAADFLSANRCAGRYLLMGAELMSFISAVMFIANFEQYYQGGFPVFWWSRLMILGSWVVALSGWVAYRFRETRALTMAQFLEMRYSRRLRVFAGILAWGSGIVNYAIFPAVTARLLVYFCNLPNSSSFIGLTFPTFTIVMFIMLTVAVFLTLSGGQIAVMVTDFIQAQLTILCSFIVIAFLFIKFNWFDIVSVLKTAPSGESMLNPFDQSKIPDFNIWFFVISTFMWFYQYMSWQGYQGYYSAAKNPHEAKMAKLLCLGRGGSLGLFFMIVPIVVYVIFNGTDHSELTASVQSVLDSMPEKHLATQMRVPLTLTRILPVGLIGFVAAIFVASAISTDDTMLHSWGSIFVQDVLMPLRKKKLTPDQHMKWLRRSVISVAVFAFIFGLIFPVRDFIFMYWAVSSAIFTGGAGSIVIGGLYWKRGTTAAAWSSLITGSVLAVSGIIVRSFWANIPVLANFRSECPFNGMQFAFFSALISISIYIIVSLLDKKPAYNMDKMLHRGKYAIAGEHVKVVEKISVFRKLTGIDPEFNKRDKATALVMATYTFFWLSTFIVGNIYCLKYDVSDETWSKWWLFVIIFSSVWAVGTTIWFFIGGVSDLKNLFILLKGSRPDAGDDGSVKDKEDVSEEEMVTLQDNI